MISGVREHREEQVERLLFVLMGARLALGLGSLGLGLVLDSIGGEVAATAWPGFYLSVAACFVATLIYRPFVGRIRRPASFAAVNVVTDLGLVSSLIFFSGGPDSVFTFLYVVVVLYGGVLFPGWGALLGSSAASLCYAALLAISQWGWLGAAADPQPVGEVLTDWLVHALALMAAAGLAGFLARELVRAAGALDERTEDLAHLRTLHQRTVESLKSGLLTTDLEGRITSFNQEAQRITGLARSQVMGEEAEEILPGLAEVCERSGAGGAAGRARMGFCDPSGRELHLGVGAYVLRDASHDALGQVVIFQDVTEVVKMEHELRRSERLAAVGRLSAGIAHEIRNPLAAISGSIQMIRSGSGGAESERLMGIVLREVERLDRLIGEILQFARPGEPRIQAVDVSEAVRAVLEMFEASRPDSVHFECDLEPGLSVMADPGQLQQVLWNLLLNAVQAMPDGGRVRFEARTGAPAQGLSTEGRIEEGGKTPTVEISVLDQGVGIPMDVAENVFDPFFTTKAEGTGLGLAIVHRVIEEHGGVVRVARGCEGYATAIRIGLPGVREAS